MLLVIIVLSGWIIINRASENGWSIGDFLHNSDTMISDAEQSGTDNADSSGGPEQWQKEGAPYIDVELLTPNEYSRPQIPIESVQYIAWLLDTSFMSWQKPSAKKCPKCGSYMVEKGNKLVCSQETCGYVEAKDEKE